MTDPTGYSPATKVIALARFGGVTPRLFDLLMRTFGSLDGLLSADKGVISKIDGVPAQVAGRIAKSAGHLGEAEELVKSLTQRDIGVATRFDETYPHRLFELNDPPLFLLSRGRVTDSSKKAVAIVGADNATNEGIEITTKLTRRFAQDKVQILSSLGGGIGASAHLAARTVSAESFAVIESGFDSIAGSDEMALAIDIAAHGGVISEYFPESQPTTDSVSQANRLLVGLSDGVVFTELYADSKRALDALEFCDQCGKLAFFFVDPVHGALADEQSLALAVDCGAIPMRGYDSVADMVKALV